MLTTAPKQDLDSDSEWLETDGIGDDIVRQGDSLLLRDQSDEIGTVKYGLVITADCDIVQRKTSGCVSFVPIISLEEYIFRFWLPEHIEAKGHAMRCLEGLRRMLLERMQEHAPDAKPLSDVGLYRLAEEGTSGILAEPDANAKRAKRFAANIAALRSLIVLRGRTGTKRNLNDMRDHVSNFFIQSELGTLARALERAADSIKEAVTGGGSLDIYPVSRLATFENVPHIVMLRFVRSLPEERVTTSLNEFKYGQKLACRMARLRHEARYECLQRFGRLFVRAGKPDAMNNACKQKIDATVGLLAGEQ